MFSALLLIIIILQSSQVLELQIQLDERTEEVWTIFLSTLAFIHTAPEKFSTGWKIWMDMSFRQNHSISLPSSHETLSGI